MITLLVLCLATSSFAETVGPIDLTGRAPIVDSLGVQAAIGANALPVNDGFKTIGQWIWRDDGGAKPLPTRFRKAFRLDSEPGNATVYVSAEVSYRLWINGRLVSRGPADPGRDYDTPAPGPWFDDVRPVGRFLHRGENVIAAEVFPEPLVSYEGTNGHPGFKLDLRLPEADIATDSSWKCLVAEDLAHYEGENGFRIDETLAPVGWQGLGFDDSNWESAVPTAFTRPPNLVSELAPPMEAVIPPVGYERVTPEVRVEGNEGAAVFRQDGGYSIKYPRVLSARVALAINGHKGERVLIMPNEEDAPGYSRRAEILLRNGLQVVELPFLDSFSTINIEAKDVSKPLTIEWVRAIFASYPVQYKGEFECSDPNLNKMWQVCRWETQICMQTLHLDSPNHQEPVSDSGDYLIEALNSYYAFGEYALARQDLAKIARTLEQRKFQSFHTSYSLLWLHMLMQYYDYTGDDSLVRALAWPAHALLDRFETYIGKNGLISNAPNYMFMDWVEIDGFNCHHPPAVIGQGYMTALYYQALEDDMRIALLEKDTARVNDDIRLRTSIQAAFDTELWNPEAGLYRDGKPFQSDVGPNQWLPADKDIETFSTQVNSLAVSCGLADEKRSRQIMEKIMARQDLNCQPYFMHFVFEALARAGVFPEYAPSQLSRWHILPDTQSFYEMWNSGDRSHAWNATPLFQMSARILGVQPLSPGFATFSIAPLPCGLTWAKGAVPTSHGLIRVEWTQEKAGLRVKLSVPKGAIATCGGARFGPGEHEILVTISKLLRS